MPRKTKKATTKKKPSRVQIYYERDADLRHLRGRTIAVLGYGSQGRAQALNLRDSGVKILASASKPGSKGWKMAIKDGFRPLKADAASKKADGIHLLLPDEQAPAIYERSVKKNLKSGKFIAFSHGFNIHFKQIIPPKDVDVWMVAPKGPGHLVREEFEEGRGVPSLLAVHQDATGLALRTALAFSKGIGSTRSGVIRTTFGDETETDLFGEQSVLCGGLTRLVLTGYETLTDAGYPPELAYFECMHEVKLICDLMYRGGIGFMRYSISNTAEYGDLTRGPRVIGKETKRAMKKILRDIQTQKFSNEWVKEWKSGAKRFKKLRKQGETHPIEEVGRRLRGMMPWITVPKG